MIVGLHRLRGEQHVPSGGKRQDRHDSYAPDTTDTRC